MFRAVYYPVKPLAVFVISFPVMAVFPISASAENTPTYEKQASSNSVLKSVTVLGNRTDETAGMAGIVYKNLPINVMSLDREEIERIRFVDPDELLDRIPGETQVRNLRIPNGGKSYTLAFLDGMPVESPYEGATQRFDRVNTHDIERIDVLKGPVSALFPNNLFGGAINVISRAPDSINETELWLEGGSYGRSRIGINSSGPLSEGGWFYAVDASSRNQDGMRREAKNDRDQLSVKLNYAGNKRQLWTIRAEHLEEDTVTRQDLTAAQIREDQRQANRLNSAEEFKQQALSLGYEQTLDNGFVQAQFVHRSKDTVGLSRFRGPQDEIDTANQLRALWRLDFGTQNIVVGTDQYRGDQDVDQYARDDINLEGAFNRFENALDIAAYFVQHQIALTPALSLTTGLRYEKIDMESEGENSAKQSATFSKAAPKFGAIYKINDQHQVWLAVGKGLYAPTLDKLYGTTGNPDLQAEEANHYEIGTRGQLDSWHYNIAYYNQTLKNYLVTQEFFENGLDVERTTNAGQVTTQGLESVIEYAPNDAIWRIALTHTYADNQYDKFVSSSGDYSGNDLSRSPKHHGNLRVAVTPMDDLVVELETDLYSSYYSDDNNSVAGKFKRDERVHLRINYSMDQWNFWLNGNNLTDTVEDRATYRVRRGVGSLRFRTADGRNVVAGASYLF